MPNQIHNFLKLQLTGYAVLHIVHIYKYNTENLQYITTVTI